MRGQKRRWTTPGVGEPPTVAFFGLFGVGNFGNEASLRTGLEQARRVAPGARLVCICASPERVAAEHGVEAVPIAMSRRLGLSTSSPLVRRLLRPFTEVFRWTEAYRFARNVDVIVVPGTGILDDFGVRPRQMPYDIFRWSLVSRLAHTPFALVGVGAGPAIRPLSRWFFRRTVDLAASCSYRDSGSLAFMSSIGASTEASEVVPDVVLAMRTPALDDGAASSDRKVLAIGVMSYFGWESDRTKGRPVFESYIDRLAVVACGALDRGWSVRLVIGEDGDREAVEELTATVARRRPEVDPPDRLTFIPHDTMERLLDQLGRVDAVVATRYHNVVGALMVVKPTISLGYAEKNRELMDGFGLGDYCDHVDEFDGQSVLERFDRLLTEWPRLRPIVEERRDGYVREVERQFDVVIGPLIAAAPAADGGGNSGSRGRHR